MSGRKQIELHVPVPWADQPATLTIFSITAIAVVAAFVLIGMIMWKLVM